MSATGPSHYLRNDPFILPVRETLGAHSDNLLAWGVTGRQDERERPRYSGRRERPRYSGRTTGGTRPLPGRRERERETSLQWPHDRRHPPLTRRESTAEETRNQGRVRATAGKQHHAKSAQATAGHGPTQATLTRQNHHKSPHWLTCPSPAPLVSRTSKGGTRKERTKEQTAAKAG